MSLEGFGNHDVHDLINCTYWLSDVDKRTYIGFDWCNFNVKSTPHANIIIREDDFIVFLSFICYPN